ncbi:MAG: SDR family NAD(P)-dependent oxidoreductase [Halieaceae bacterium]
MTAVESGGVQSAVLVVGASGGIGAAVVRRYLEDETTHVLAVSRNACPAAMVGHDDQLRWIQCDQSEESIQSVVADIAASDVHLHRVVICTGVLHGDGFSPEKALDAVTGETLQAVMNVNLVVPAAWVSALAKPLRRSPDTVIAVLSARVGSIGDNQLGGWYSYRSSKAALNMFLKSAAIEYARRARGVKLVAFHPGTTDTELSKPFQANVPAGKLFTTDFVAGQLVALLDQQEQDGELSYLDWAGQSIPW